MSERNTSFFFLIGEQDSHVQGAILVLSKYVTMLHEHVGHIMPTALHMAQISQDHFVRVGNILQKGPMGVILPEISLGLVLLQLRMPSLLQVHVQSYVPITKLDGPNLMLFNLLVIQDSRCVSLVGDLVRQLDGFNQLRPRAAEEDEEDMAWPGIRSK